MRNSQLLDNRNIILGIGRILVILLLVVAFWPSILSGQITWNKRYGVPGNGHPEVARSVEVVEDGYVVFYFDENPNGSNRMNVMKIDLEGDSLFSKSWSDSPNSYYIGWMDPANKTQDDGFVLGGGYLDQGTGINYTLLTKWDSDLDTLWTRQIGDTANWNTGRDAIELEDGRIALVGLTDISIQNYQIMVALFESNGDHIWTNYYGDLESDEDYGFVATEIPGDGIYIGGGIELALGGINAPRIIKIDYDGNLVWDEIYDDFDHNNGWAVPLATSDGKLYFSANQFDYEDEFYEYDVTRLVNVDSQDGSILWEDTYGEANRNQASFNVKEDFSGNIVISGDQANETGQSQGFLKKISSEGELLWDRGFQYSDVLGSVHYNFDTEPTPDGGYVGCGYMITIPPEPNSPSQDLWVYKLDSMGCFVPGCGVGVEEFRKKEGLMKIGPNPVNKGQFLNVYISKLATFEVQYLNLIDAQGRLVKKVPVNGSDSTIIIMVSDLQSGAYLIELEGNNQVLECERLIVE